MAADPVKRQVGLYPFPRAKQSLGMVIKVNRILFGAPAITARNEKKPHNSI